MKIVITDAGTVFDERVKADIFEQFGEVESHHLLKYNEIADAVADADIVLWNKSLMDSTTLAKATHLKYVGVFATGYNNIDLEYCRSKGITVCNAGSYSTKAVAQHTFALILEHFSRVREYSKFVENGGWQRSDTFSPFITDHNEIFEKTIGIVGFGSIGQEVAKIADAFGMNVLFYNRSQKQSDFAKQVTFDELLEQSDVVTVHCPLNSDSSKMFSKEQFKKMKKTAFFVNTARGGVLDEQALRDALDNEIIAGAGIDVLTVEPMEGDCPIVGAKNCIVTPHIAWAPVETRKRLIGIVADNIKAWQNGNPINVVN